MGSTDYCMPHTVYGQSKWMQWAYMLYNLYTKILRIKDITLPMHAT